MPDAPLVSTPTPPPIGVWRLSAQAWWALLGLAVSALLLAQFGSVLLRAFWIVFGGVLLGLAVRPLVERMARRHVPRVVTVLAVYLLIAGLAVTVTLHVVPVAESGLSQLRASLPDVLHSVAERAARIPGLGDQLPTLDDVAQRAAAEASTVAFTLAGLIQGLGELAVEVLVAFILGYSVATASLKSAASLLTWLPPRLRPRARALAQTLSTNLAHAVWAQLGVALYFGTFIWIGFSVVGVPYAGTIALLAGTLEVIPFVGSVTAFVLGVLSALTLGVWPAVWAVVAHQIVTHTEAELVSPYLMGRVVEIHPAVILVGALLAIWMFGLIGGFFAVPLLVVLRTALVAWHEQSAPEAAAPEPRASEAHAPLVA